MKVMLENVKINATRVGPNTFEIESDLPGLPKQIEVREGDKATLTIPNVLVEAEIPPNLIINGVIQS